MSENNINDKNSTPDMESRQTQNHPQQENHNYSYDGYRQYSNPYSQQQNDNSYNGQQGWQQNYQQQYYDNYYQQGYGPQQNYNGQQGWQQPYGYYGQPYANPQSAWQQPMITHGPVNPIFCYILMVITPISFILSFLSAKIMMSSINFEAFYSSSYSSIIAALDEVPQPAALASLNSLLSVAILALSIIDIVSIYKQRYPVLGLILFMAFLKPGYFIWRAHVLKQKMLVPVLYTAFLGLLYLGYFIWCFSYAMTIVSGVIS